MRAKAIIERLQQITDDYLDNSNTSFGYAFGQKINGNVTSGNIYVSLKESVVKYYKLLENEKKFYLIECDKEGNLSEDFSFENHKSLNSLRSTEFEKLVEGLQPLLPE